MNLDARYVTAQRRRFIAAARPGAPGHAGVIASIRAKRGEAMAAAFAQSTRGMQLTAMRHFVEYSEVCGVDYRLFGAADDGRCMVGFSEDYWVADAVPLIDAEDAAGQPVPKGAGGAVARATLGPPQSPPARLQWR